MKIKAWIIYNRNANNAIGVFDTKANAVGFIRNELVLTVRSAAEIGYYIRRATITFRGGKHAGR